MKRNTEIKTVTLAESIRLRPAMYLGWLNQNGIEHEIAAFLFSLIPLDNSARFIFTLDGDTISMKAESIVTDKYKYYFEPKDEYGKLWDNRRLHDPLSIFVLACASETSQLTVSGEKEIFRVSSIKNQFECKCEAHKDSLHTLEMSFIPDKEIFVSLRLRFDYFLNFFYQQSFLLPYLTIELNNKITHEHVIFSNSGGMSDYADTLFHQLGRMPEFRFDNKIKLSNYELEAVIAYMPEYCDKKPIIKMWAEGDYLYGGSLENGILKGISKAFPVKDDPSKRLVLCAHIKGDYFAFEGSVKDKLKMSELETELEHIIFTELKLKAKKK
ncbi:MAG: hypothetical protein E6767_19895 [Dysgonomonas sp.]|nr:hypothetical protein [Dysgonomonas sp.]